MLTSSNVLQTWLKSYIREVLHRKRCKRLERAAWQFQSLPLWYTSTSRGTVFTLQSILKESEGKFTSVHFFSIILLFHLNWLFPSKPEHHNALIPETCSLRHSNCPKSFQCRERCIMSALACFMLTVACFSHHLWITKVLWGIMKPITHLKQLCTKYIVQDIRDKIIFIVSFFQRPDNSKVFTKRIIFNYSCHP